MHITRNSLDTNPGPADWFTGSVFVDPIAGPPAPARASAAACLLYTSDAADE